MDNIDELSKAIWDYMILNHKLEKVDLILVLGSLDLRVADRGAELFLQNYAPYILFSGGIGHTQDLLKTAWEGSEAEMFAKRAIELGVPKEKILIESKSTNTGENIQFSFEVINKNNLDANKIILVQKPYMERRTFATFMKQWPGKKVEILVTSPNLSFDEYIKNTDIPKDTIINLMVGDLQRIKEYPAKGFQIHQDIPETVWKAYEELVNLGFTKHLIK